LALLGPTGMSDLTSAIEGIPDEIALPGLTRTISFRIRGSFVSKKAPSAEAERGQPRSGEIQFVRTAGARFHTSTLDVPGPTDGAGFVYVS